MNQDRTVPEPLAKRRRGRPRKDENLPPKEKPLSNYLKNIVIHEAEIKPIDYSHENVNQLDEMVGQQVSGVIEGSFDSGFLLAVKTPPIDTVMRGVVFYPGRICSVTPVNDIAPLVKMNTRKEVPVDKNVEIPMNFVPNSTESEIKNNLSQNQSEDQNQNQNQNQNQFQDPIFPHGEKGLVQGQGQFGIGNSFITMLTTDASFPAANPPFVLNNQTQTQSSGQSSCLGEQQQQQQQTLERLFSPHLQQSNNRGLEEVGVGVAAGGGERLMEGEMVGSDHRQVIDGGTQEQQGKGTDEGNGC